MLPALFWIFTAIFPYCTVGPLFTVRSGSSTILLITHDFSVAMHIAVIMYNTKVFIWVVFKFALIQMWGGESLCRGVKLNYFC